MELVIFLKVITVIILLPITTTGIEVFFKTKDITVKIKGIITHRSELLIVGMKDILCLMLFPLAFIVKFIVVISLIMNFL